MSRTGALWIGGLEPYMDENFLDTAMTYLGQDGVVSIKIMNNKYTGEPAGYGFINFEDDQRAIYSMHRLAGKVIPNSNPPVLFKLNHSSTRLQPGEPDYSIWVGDLTPDVDDFGLYQFFTLHLRYQTVRFAKVIVDQGGISKGFGFVRFGSEYEQQNALFNSTGECGLGQKPIKVSTANQNRGGGGGVPENPAATGGIRQGQIANGGASWHGMRPDSQGDSGSWASQQHQPHGGMGGQAWRSSMGQAHGWPTTGSQGSQSSGQPSAAPAPAQPDYSAYHQYYQQYGQQFSQQQQQYAAAYAAWQHQQQQLQQTGNHKPQ